MSTKGKLLRLQKAIPLGIPNLDVLMLWVLEHLSMLLAFSEQPSRTKHWGCHEHKLFLDPDWAGNPRSPEAAVSIGVLAEVLLMVIFSVIKLRSLPDFCCDGTKTAFCQYLLIFFLRFQGSFHLFLGKGVDGWAILSAKVITLPHSLCRVMILPEDLEQFLKADVFWLIYHSYNLCVASSTWTDFFVGRIRSIPSCVTHVSGVDSFLSPKLPLSSPETAHTKYSHLCSLWERLYHSVSIDMMFICYRNALAPTGERLFLPRQPGGRVAHPEGGAAEPEEAPRRR